ncbi:hypothetical protein [Paenibacillus alvei]|uniref:hypothetical protein n=1 Tax=Paenibacillus alvei TaxID=44250 RepID=UPI0013DA78B9|nr:hypothetical protein [Paenibacillus alvei]MCY9543469.1 hypothetical protein [Paenibacillus alvei]MEC0082258.1 hypothetical protein [Paenibacillus alvei]NEZ45506.1 hypothetical protein [Paenibacillus alvei]
MWTVIVKFLNSIIKGVGAALTWVIGLLPDSPFQSPSQPPDSVNLGYVTWLIDFPTMIQHLTFVLGAIGIYYIVRVIGRWIKVSRS